MIGQQAQWGRGIRDTRSQCPFQIGLHDEEGFIASATAFFYDFGGENFLVTNWHNVSGRDWADQTKSAARCPTILRAKLSKYVANNTFGIFEHDIPLYNAELSIPKWFEHPVLGSRCDVIAIPVQRPASMPEMMHHPANTISSTRIPIKPGCVAFILGFPHAISVGYGLPVWKSGFIASEPFYDVTIDGERSNQGAMSGGRNLPAFFLDALTRKGMSGSPVFAAYSGTWDMTNPYRDVNPQEPGFMNRDDIAIGGQAYEFVGIYSGRIGKTEESAALGLCWRDDTIGAVCGAKVVGQHPHR